MGNYINDFTPYQLDQFELCFKKVMKNKLMSFYSYLMYHSSSNEQIKISIDELSERWNNKHKKKADESKCVCRATIYNWIKKLEAAALIKIDSEIADTFVYSLVTEKFFLDEKLDKELDKQNTTKDIENTNFDNDETCDNTPSFELNIDLDSNSLAAPAHDNFNYSSYIERQEKNCSWNQVCELMTDAFKLLRVKSEWIKSRVIGKISQYHEGITKKHLMAYICKVIADARQIYYPNYDKLIKANNEEESTFNDFPQRKYDFDELERKLLGGLSK